MSARPYQAAALAASYEAYKNEEVFRQLIAHATGTGKTFIFSNLRKHHKFTKRGMVWLHRDELAQQAAEKMKRWNPTLKVGIEMGDSYASDSDDIVIGSVPTLGRGGKRILRFRPDEFDHHVCDEAHHSTAQSYLNCFDHFHLLDPDSETFLLGVTATPNRSDGSALAKVYDRIVHQYQMYDAIKDGWLADLRGLKVNTDVDLDSVNVRSGDFVVEELAQAVNQKKRNALIVDAWMQEARNLQTIVFCVDIAHAQMLAEEFQRAGRKAAAIWGSDPDRKLKLQMHKEGKLEILTNCQVLTEGYDDWQIECVLGARPTKSQLLYVQMAGRGTRIENFPGGLSLLAAREAGLKINKERCLLMDVVDNTQRHSLTTLASIFGLNRNMDLHGRSVVGTVDEISALSKKHPNVDFSRLEDIGRLKKFIEEVDLWKIKWAPEVMEHSLLQWHKRPDGSLMLALPHNEAVVVRKNLLDQYEVNATINDNQINEKNMKSLPDAFQFAEQMVGLFGKEYLPLLRRNGTGAKWHAKKITDKQLERLKRFYGDKPEFAKLTRAEAAEMITKKLLGFRERKRREEEEFAPW